MRSGTGYQRSGLLTRARRNRKEWADSPAGQKAEPVILTQALVSWRYFNSWDFRMPRNPTIRRRELLT
jgi:hypothetical protein